MIKRDIEETIQDRIDEIAVKGVPRDIDQYLDTKLSLYSNLKERLDCIPNLKQIVTAYMQSNEQGYPTKQAFKDKLVLSGLLNDEDQLEFLLLISEKQRDFNSLPLNTSDDELGKYFFDKYRGQNESWSQKTFRFELKENNSYQREKKRVIEEVAIRMISHSRASLAKVITGPPPEISKTIRDADAYFQQAFYSTFRINAPISLANVTHVTKDYTGHADKIIGKAFIHLGDFYKDRDKFIHLVIHEGMHLCFDGFYEDRIEEGLIEFLVEKMYQENPYTGFNYRPVSEEYSGWKQNFRSVFVALPGAESHFTQYFLTQDIVPLRIYLQEQLTDRNLAEIENNHYSRGINNFLDSMKKLVINY